MGHAKERLRWSHGSDAHTQPRAEPRGAARTRGQERGGPDSVTTTLPWAQGQEWCGPDSVSATHPQAIMRCSLRHTLLCNVNFHDLNQHYCSPWFQDETSLEEKKKPLTFRTSDKTAPYIIQLYIITTECSI